MISKISQRVIPSQNLGIQKKAKAQKVAFTGTPAQEIRVAINAGTGRIGKNAFQQITEHFSRYNETLEQIVGDIRNLPVKLKLVAMNVGTPDKVNDIAGIMRHDSVMGYFPANLKSVIEDGKNYLLVGEGNSQEKIRIFGERNIPNWADVDADIVIDATGALTTTEKLAGHLENGAKRVLLSAPPKGDGVNSYIFGVNHNLLTPEEKIVSNASCTTNCLSTLTSIIKHVFGISEGMAETIHGLTQTQFIHDKGYASKLRSGLDNIIPTTTGAAKETGKVIPELNKKLLADALRVPNLDGSLVSAYYNLLKNASPDEIIDVLRMANKSQELRRFIGEAPANSTSKDILGRMENAIFIPESVKTVGPMAHVKAWYDNEFGYTRNLLDTARLMGAQMKGVEYNPRTIKQVLPDLIG
ncbi:MAG: glyceraldehyde 3-phosphate dehydrogenase NAD-binding domain-containing protein [Candidatus Gastranaerophilaceae bacterium]